MKNYQLSWREVVHEISYPNLILLSAVIPDYESKRVPEGKSIEADDPANNDRIKQLLRL